MRHVSILYWNTIDSDLDRGSLRYRWKDLDIIDILVLLDDKEAI